MASGGRSLAGTGGKVLRQRRFSRVATPYDRPANPSWISKLVLSPSRVIASGAGKFLSSVFGPESSSSSSDSESESLSGSDNAIEEDNNNVGKSSVGLDEMGEEKGKPETARPSTEESINGNKLLIEQLLSQESFSMEECERLTCIIKSRVVEDREMPDLSTALMEANKWVKEKKSRAVPELDLTCGLSPHLNEGHNGSPVVVAKSYMKDRPPWVSPYSIGGGQISASPMGIRLFKDDDPLSFGGSSLSTSKSQLKRDGHIIGSWNITEEIRRVRSKATEQMLNRPSEKKVDLSISKPSSSATKLSRPVMEYKYSLDSLANNDSGAGLGDHIQPSTTFIDALQDMSAEDIACGNAIENRSDHEVPNNSSVLMSEDQGPEDGLGDIKTVVPRDNTGTDGNIHMNPNGSGQPHGDIIPDTRGNDGACSILKEGSWTSDPSDPNGLQQTTPRERNPPVDRKHMETHEPRKEATPEAPNLKKNDDNANGSQNSSSMHYEERTPNTSRQIGKQASPKRGRNITRYGRKVRGRGK